MNLSRDKGNLPTVPAATSAEIRLLEAPKVGGKGTSTGYKFVYQRGSSPGPSPRKRTSTRPQGEEVCRTLRVRIKKLSGPDGKNVYEEFSGNWTAPREAAAFVVGLFKLRYGDWWTRALDHNNRREYFITRDPDEDWKFWVTIMLAGRRIPLDNPAESEGFFWYREHALWFVRAWCEAKFPAAGMSALGFDPLPPDTLNDAAALAEMPRRPRRWELHWIPMFEGCE